MKKLDEIEEKMINLEADNSLSHVRDEELMNRHINNIQTNILNNKLQVTHEIADSDSPAVDGSDSHVLPSLHAQAAYSHALIH